MPHPDPDRMIQVSQGTIDQLCKLIQRQHDVIIALDKLATVLLARRAKHQAKHQNKEVGE